MKRWTVLIVTAMVMAVVPWLAVPALAISDIDARSDPVQSVLTASFNRLSKSELGGTVGMVVMPCAKRGQRYRERLRFGTWTTGPAWSTYKVPLSLWALADSPGAWTNGLVKRAIRQSDNDAAQLMRRMLGGQPQASARYTKQVRRYWPKNPAFASHLNGFGPANWSLTAQAAFMAGLSQATGKAGSRVLREMGQIASDQSWGLGAVNWGQRKAYFKGGWAEHGYAGWTRVGGGAPPAPAACPVRWV